jgi:hypothetical protein
VATITSGARWRRALLRVARDLLMVRAMLRIRSLSFALAVLAAAACGGKKDDNDKAKTPPPVAEPAPVAPAPPPPPPAPTYSPEAAKEQIGKLADCVIPDNCEAYKTLVGFGPQAGGDLMAALADPAVDKDAKKLAAHAVAALKVPDAGPRLVELGHAADDHMLQRDLYAAAGKAGGQATFDALIAAYEQAIASLDDDRDIPLRQGLSAFPAESLAWAKAALAKKGKGAPDPTSAADLFTDSATAADLPVVVEALGATKDTMARHRLAAKAIELGDTAHFEVFVAGLSSKDQYDRSDAANFLAKVADKVPADLKPKLVELLQKGKAADAGGMTSMGYDEALKKLGA